MLFAELSVVTGLTLVMQDTALDDIQGRHYIITVYGCTPETYGCIPQEKTTATYRSLLAARNPFGDMPRTEDADNLDAYYKLKPALYKSKNFSW